MDEDILLPSQIYENPCHAPVAAPDFGRKAPPKAPNFGPSRLMGVAWQWHGCWARSLRKVCALLPRSLKPRDRSLFDEGGACRNFRFQAVSNLNCAYFPDPTMNSDSGAFCQPPSRQPQPANPNVKKNRLLRASTASPRLKEAKLPQRWAACRC